MDAVNRLAWREVLRELRELEAEYERVSREKAEHCSSKQSAEAVPQLIELSTE
jgi:hypothetical protein